MTFSDQDKQRLLQIAKDSIRCGLDTGHPLKLNLSDCSASLLQMGASFVTLEKGGALRGCIGTLQAYQMVAQDVADHAFAAAFSDPRFPPLEEGEFSNLEIHISILSAAEEMHFTSEQDLLAQLRPGIDGLILEEGHQRGTFLPSVWESLATPTEFLQHLKQKAGLPMSYWSNSVRVSRYTTLAIP